MKKGLISVIIPCKDTYSIEMFCLKSLEDQIFKEYELIIKQGTNVCVNRNAGAKDSAGEYLFFLDNDIKLRPDCLSTMYMTLECNPDYDFAYCHYNREGELQGPHMAREWDYDYLKTRNYISTMSLVRASKFPGFNESLERFQDWDLWLRMAENGSKGYFIPEILFTAVYKKGGISTNKENYARSMQKIYDLHKNKNV